MAGEGGENAASEADARQAKITEDVWRWAKRQAIVYMDLSFGAKECWRILDGFPLGSSFPSHYFIAETLGKSRSAVRRYLRELKGRGYIQITPQFDKPRKGSRSRGDHRPPRGQTSNAYRVLDQSDLIARAKLIFQEWQAKQQRSNA
jgi:hypothetical protein